MADLDSEKPALDLTGNRWWVLPLAALLGAVFLLLWQVLVGDQNLFYRDLYRQHFGTARLLASGNFPFGLLWDPLLNGSQPLLANPNRFLLYPSRLLYLILSPATALNWEITLHLVLGGSGTIVLARRLGLSGAATGVAGVSYALGGLSISLTNHLGRLLAYHWLPWIVLATHLAFHRGKPGPHRLGLMLPVCLALQWLTGAAELAAMGGALVLVWSLASGDGRRGRGSIITLALIAVIAGVALAAIQVLPSAEMVFRSERGLGTPAEMSLTWSMHPLRVFEFVVPGFLGPVDVADPSSQYWGARLVDFGFPYLLSLYFGAATLLLALFGFAGSAHHPQWRRWRWSLLGLAALGAVAFGRYLPLVGEFLPSIPGLDLLRFPVKALLLTGLPVALLAGRGVDVTINAKGSMQRRLVVVAGGSVCLFVTGVIAIASGLARPVLDLLFTDHARLAERGLILPCARSAIVVAGVLLVLLAGSRLRMATRSAVLVLLVAVDLVGAGAAALPLAPRETVSNPPPILQTINREIGHGRFFRDRDPESFVVPLAADRAWAAADWWQLVLDGSLAANWGVPMVFHSDAEVIAGRRMAALARTAMAAPWNDRVALLRIAGASLVMTPDRPEIEGLTEVAADELADGVVYRFYSVDGPAMVRWLASQRMVSSESEALRGLVSQSFDPSVEVLREMDAPLSEIAGGTLGPLRPRTELWQGTVDAPALGFVVTAIPWHPDIVVEIDGRLVPAEQVNYAFVGAPISPGRHVLRVLFAPRSVMWGGLLSVLVLLSLVVTAVLGSRFGGRFVRSRTDPRG